jgi:hypothetical protein
MPSLQMLHALSRREVDLLLLYSYSTRTMVGGESAPERIPDPNHSTGGMSLVDILPPSFGDPNVPAQSD